MAKTRIYILLLEGPGPLDLPLGLTCGTGGGSCPPSAMTQRRYVSVASERGVVAMTTQLSGRCVPSSPAPKNKHGQQTNYIHSDMVCVRAHTHTNAQVSTRLHAHTHAHNHFMALERNQPTLCVSSVRVCASVYVHASTQLSVSFINNHSLSCVRLFVCLFVCLSTQQSDSVCQQPETRCFCHA